MSKTRRQEIQDSKFTQLLRERFELSGMSRQDLALATNLDVSTIARLLSGGRQPGSEVVVRLAHMLADDVWEWDNLLAAAGFVRTHLEALLHEPEVERLVRFLLDESGRDQHEWVLAKLADIVEEARKLFPPVS